MSGRVLLQTLVVLYNIKTEIIVMNEKKIDNNLCGGLTLQGEKYFVLKKTKEAPAVLRKPPRTHAHPKSRPVSGPPVFRNTKVLEEFGRSASVGGSILELTPAEKENRLPAEGINKVLAKAMSVDSAMESDVSTCNLFTYFPIQLPIPRRIISWGGQATKHYEIDNKKINKKINSGLQECVEVTKYDCKTD